MNRVLGFSTWTSLLLAAVTVAHPSCSTIYGNPSGVDCRRILDTFTHGRADRGAVHCFAPAGMSHPDDVTNPQWQHRVDIPKFWARDDSPGCRVALFPVLATDGTLSYDISRALSVQGIGYGISHYCPEALGIPGLVGSGGIDSAGDNNKLRLILYAPKSKFENDTISDYQNNKPIAVQEDTDDEYEPGPSNTSSPPRKRPRVAGMGLMTSGSIKTQTRNLSDGWYMVFDAIMSVLPAQPAAASLVSFYNNVIDTTASQLSTAVNTTENLAFKFGEIHLRLSSATPINWSWVINFASDMLDNISPGFAVMFNGKAYSAYWDIPPVTAIMTTV